MKLRDLLHYRSSLSHDDLRSALHEIIGAVGKIKGDKDVNSLFGAVGERLASCGVTTIFSVIDDKKSHITFKYDRHLDSLEELGSFFADKLLGKKYPLGLFREYAQAMEQKTWILIDDYAKSFTEKIPAARHLNLPKRKLHSIIIPLYIKQEIVGFCEFISSALDKKHADDLLDFGERFLAELSNAILYSEVKKSEAQYKDLFENANEGFFILNNRLRRFREVNIEMSKITGYTKTELTQMNFSSLFSLSDRRRIESYVKNMAPVGHDSDISPWEYEAKIITKRGELKYVKIIVARIIDDQEWFGAMNDISQEKYTTQRLVANNTLLRMADKHHNLQSYLKDVLHEIKSWSQCNFVSVKLKNKNNAFHFLADTGGVKEIIEQENRLIAENNDCLCSRMANGKMRPEELALATNFGSFLSGDLGSFIGQGQPDIRRYYRGKCFSNGFSSLSCTPIKHGDEIIGVITLGHEKPRRITPDLVDFIENVSLLMGEAIHNYIVEDDYHRLNILNQKILDNIPVSIALLDKQGSIEMINEFGCKLIGLKLDDIIGTKLTDTPEISGEKKLVKDYSSLLREGKPFYFDNLPYIYSKTKQLKYLNITGVPVYGPNGNLEGAISIAMDNTETIVYKNQLEILNADLENQVHDRTIALEETNEKLKKVLDLKSKFISDASHELRTPLTIIQGNMDLAAKEAEITGGPEPELLPIINHEVDRMIGVLSDLTLLTNADAKAEAFLCEKVDINRLTEVVAESLKVLADKKNIALNNRLNGQSPWVMGDEAKLEKLLLNIVRNATKYTEENGTVDIWSEKNNGHVRIFVKDDGIGIPDEDIPYIFERFYRVDKSRSRNEGGTGLGLSICQWIAEGHGGRIDVESKVGAGSTFIITLPVDKKKAAR